MSEERECKAATVGKTREGAEARDRAREGSGRVKIGPASS